MIHLITPAYIYLAVLYSKVDLSMMSSVDEIAILPAYGNQNR